MIKTIIVALTSVFLSVFFYTLLKQLEDSKPAFKKIIRTAVVYGVLGVIATGGVLLAFNTVVALTKTCYMIILLYL